MKLVALRRLASALLIVTLTSASALAQRSAESPEDLASSLDLLDELQRGDLADLDLSSFNEELWALSAYDALFQNKFVRARELSQQILDQDPDSVPGHALMGMVNHRAEGNLPRALFHLTRSRELVEDRYGPVPDEDAPWRWHALSILEMAMVSGAMGRHEDKIRLLERRDELYEPDYPADRGWPLMRLRRYDEAREAVVQALALENQPGQTAQALTALCAIEAELQDRERGYQACLRAAEHERQSGGGAPTPFTNAAEASLGLLRMDQAESLILEATEYFAWGTVSNPWLDLTQLYTLEGRIPEALDAVRRMTQWRNRQPPFMDEQNRAETEMTSAVFLIVAGRPESAAAITRRAMERPDRTGFTSSNTEQLQAAAALIDLRAQLTAAEMAAETASWAELWPATKARAEELQRRLRAWSSGRRAAALMADERILVSSLRPYLAGSIELPEWLEPTLVSVLGPGVVAAALERAEAIETLDAASGYFAAFRAEIAFAQGDERAALDHIEEASNTLPGSEVLLRARLAARGAQAARANGDAERALAYFDRAMQMDPGVIRRLGIALPTRISASAGPIAKQAAKHLRRSPRLDLEDWGFEVQIEGLTDAGDACLIGPRGTRISCTVVQARAGDDVESIGRRLAKEFHQQTFAPRLDLTQADLRSLDGSPTAAGGRSHERMKSVLSELTGESE